MRQAIHRTDKLFSRAAHRIGLSDQTEQGLFQRANGAVEVCPQALVLFGERAMQPVGEVAKRQSVKAVGEIPHHLNLGLGVIQLILQGLLFLGLVELGGEARLFLSLFSNTASLLLRDEQGDDLTNLILAGSETSWRRQNFARR